MQTVMSSLLHSFKKFLHRIVSQNIYNVYQPITMINGSELGNKYNIIQKVIRLYNANSCTAVIGIKFPIRNHKELISLEQFLLLVITVSRIFIAVD